MTLGHRPCMENAKHGYANQAKPDFRSSPYCNPRWLKPTVLDMCPRHITPFVFSRCSALLHPPRQLKLALLDACPRHAAPCFSARQISANAHVNMAFASAWLAAFSILEKNKVSVQHPIHNTQRVLHRDTDALPCVKARLFCVLSTHHFVSG